MEECLDDFEVLSGYRSLPASSGTRGVTVVVGTREQSSAGKRCMSIYARS
jgi:hypothetical protein